MILVLEMSADFSILDWVKILVIYISAFRNAVNEYQGKCDHLKWTENVSIDIAIALACTVKFRPQHLTRYGSSWGAMKPWK